MASLHHILMGRNGDYFLNYIDYSKYFDDITRCGKLIQMVHKLNIRVFLAAKKPWVWFSYTFWCHLTNSYRFFWYHKNWRFYLWLLLNFQKNAKIQSLIKASNLWNISKFNKSMTNLNIFCKEKAHWVLQKQKNAKWKINLGMQPLIHFTTYTVYWLD